MGKNLPDALSAARWAFLIAAILFLVVDLTTAESAFGQRAAFAPRRTSLVDVSMMLPKSTLLVRGGASKPAVDSDDEDEESDQEEEEEEADITEQLIHELEEEDDEEEEEEKETLDPKLTAAAVKSSVKTKAKAEAAKSSKVKEAVNIKLATKKAATKKKSVGSLFRLPYIMRACLNPFTAYAMTKAFWVSLFNLDYPPKDTSQDLRSSLEEKNRKAGGGASSKPKRKMKRGQAKTLSDLPQLNT